MVPVSCDFTYLVDLTISLYNSCPNDASEGITSKSTATISYRRNRIISSVLRRKNVELVMAALNRGGSVRPECAY
jgi:hypothetical protein